MLCTQLFVGFGYSDAFCLNMEHIIHLLYQPEQHVRLVCETDSICVKCPNLLSNLSCRCDNRDDEETTTNVVAKDLYLLKSLQLQQNKVYPFETIYDIVNERLTKDMFLHSCRSCRWFQEGLCSHEQFVKARK